MKSNFAENGRSIIREGEIGFEIVFLLRGNALISRKRNNLLLESDDINSNLNSNLNEIISPYCSKNKNKNSNWNRTGYFRDGHLPVRSKSFDSALNFKINPNFIETLKNEIFNTQHEQKEENIGNNENNNYQINAIEALDNSTTEPSVKGVSIGRERGSDGDEILEFISQNSEKSMRRIEKKIIINENQSEDEINNMNIPYNKINEKINENENEKKMNNTDNKYIQGDKKDTNEKKKKNGTGDGDGDGLDWDFTPMVSPNNRNLHKDNETEKRQTESRRNDDNNNNNNNYDKNNRNNNDNNDNHDNDKIPLSHENELEKDEKNVKKERKEFRKKPPDSIREGRGFTENDFHERNPSDEIDDIETFSSIENYNYNIDNDNGNSNDDNNLQKELKEKIDIKDVNKEKKREEKKRKQEEKEKKKQEQKQKQEETDKMKFKNIELCKEIKIKVRRLPTSSSSSKMPVVRNIFQIKEKLVKVGTRVKEEIRRKSAHINHFTTFEKTTEIVGNMVEGDVIGYDELLHNKKYEYSIIASENIWYYTLERTAVLTLLDNQPRIALELQRALALCFNDINEKMKKSKKFKDKLDFFTEIKENFKKVKSESKIPLKKGIGFSSVVTSVMKNNSMMKRKSTESLNVDSSSQVIHSSIDRNESDKNGNNDNNSNNNDNNYNINNNNDNNNNLSNNINSMKDDEDRNKVTSVKRNKARSLFSILSSINPIININKKNNNEKNKEKKNGNEKNKKNKDDDDSNFTYEKTFSQKLAKLDKIYDLYKKSNVDSNDIDSMGISSPRNFSNNIKPKKKDSNKKKEDGIDIDHNGNNNNNHNEHPKNYNYDYDENDDNYDKNKKSSLSLDIPKVDKKSSYSQFILEKLSPSFHMKNNNINNKKVQSKYNNVGIAYEKDCNNSNVRQVVRRKSVDGTPLMNPRTLIDQGEVGKGSVLNQLSRPRRRLSTGSENEISSHEMKKKTNNPNNNNNNNNNNSNSGEIFIKTHRSTSDLQRVPLLDFDKIPNLRRNSMGQSSNSEKCNNYNYNNYNNNNYNNNNNNNNNNNYNNKYHNYYDDDNNNDYDDYSDNEHVPNPYHNNSSKNSNSNLINKFYNKSNNNNDDGNVNNSKQSNSGKSHADNSALKYMYNKPNIRNL